MAEATDSPPAICQRIRDTREHRKSQWKSDHPGERGNPYTQEAVAGRVGVTLGAYGAWERNREPDLARLRQIAQALNLDEDYFLPTGDLTLATSRVEAEADRLERTNDDLQGLLEALRALLREGPPAQAGDEP